MSEKSKESADAARYDDILIIDFCSDKNRGDAAMQRGLLKVVEARYPNAKISILAWYGWNQQASFDDVFCETLKGGAPIYGGLRKTYYAFNGVAGSRFKKRLVIFVSLLKSIVDLGILTLFPRLYRRIFERAGRGESALRLRKADLVVWNGRNFRGGGWWSELYVALIMTYHARIAAGLGKTVVCIGASVWPLTNPIARSITYSSLSKCAYVTARELVTYEELSRQGLDTEIYLGPDLSLAFLESRPRPANTPSNRIGLTLVDWDRDGVGVVETYIAVMRSVVLELMGRGLQIVVIPQVTGLEQDNSTSINCLMSCIPASLTQSIAVISDELETSELLDIYSSLDFLIASRMHSAIFAASVGTPSVCVAYDSGAKWSIVKELGIDVLPMKSLKAGISDRAIIRAFDQRKGNVTAVISAYEKQLQNMDLHFDPLSAKSEN